MDITQLQKSIKVIGQSYRGASYPQFDPKAINESRIPDTMRFKDYDVELEGNTIHIYYKTQEPYTNSQLSDFKREFKRAIEVLRDGLTGFRIHCKVYDRDGVGEDTFNLQY